MSKQTISLTIFRSSFKIPGSFDLNTITNEFLMDSICANMCFASFEPEILKEIFEANWLSDHFDEDAPDDGPEPSRIEILEYSVKNNFLYISANIEYKVSLNPNYQNEDQLNESLDTPGDLIDNFSLWPTDCDDEFEYQGHEGITVITIRH